MTTHNCASEKPPSRANLSKPLTVSRPNPRLRNDASTATNLMCKSPGIGAPAPSFSRTCAPKAIETRCPSYLPVSRQSDLSAQSNTTSEASAFESGASGPFELNARYHKSPSRLNEIAGAANDDAPLFRDRGNPRRRRPMPLVSLPPKHSNGAARPALPCRLVAGASKRGARKKVASRTH